MPPSHFMSTIISTMAHNDEVDDSNPFCPLNLTDEKAKVFHTYGLLVPSDHRLENKTWRPCVLPVPTGAELRLANLQHQDRTTGEGRGEHGASSLNGSGTPLSLCLMTCSNRLRTTPNGGQTGGVCTATQWRTPSSKDSSSVVSSTSPPLRWLRLRRR